MPKITERTGYRKVYFEQSVTYKHMALMARAKLLKLGEKWRPQAEEYARVSQRFYQKYKQLGGTLSYSRVEAEAQVQYKKSYSEWSKNKGSF